MCDTLKLRGQCRNVVLKRQDAAGQGKMWHFVTSTSLLCSTQDIILIFHRPCH